MKAKAIGSKIDTAVDKAGAAMAGSKASEHRLQETAQKVGHRAKEFASKVAHAAEETVEKVTEGTKKLVGKAKPNVH